MTIDVKALSLDNLELLTLEQIVPPTQELSTSDNVFHLSNNTLLLGNSLKVTLPASSSLVNSTIETNSANNDIALVVFGSLTINDLINITAVCQLTLNRLVAINYRNNLFSYRFSVSCENLEQSKTKLAEYTLANNIESALIKNAPKLSVPGVLVMDMDSTTIEIECIDEIAALAGVGEQVAEVTELAMQGKLDFAQSLHQRVGTLADSSETILAEVAKNIPLMPGLETLITELKKHNWRVAIASGGFTYFADYLKDMLDLDAAHANVLEIVDGKLTGKVLGDVVDAQAKADCLLSLSEDYGIAHSQTVAMGDGANDLVMMEAAHLGVAFHAKPLVLKQADTAINISGLDCLLHWLA